MKNGNAHDIFRCQHLPSHGDVTAAYCDACHDHSDPLVPRGPTPVEVIDGKLPESNPSQPEYEPNPEGATKRIKRAWRIKMKNNQPSGSRSILESSPGMCQDRAGRAGGMAGLYYGADLYLLLGGPSAGDLDLNLLGRRGVLSMAVNNAALTYQTNLFICGDPPRKFHDAIWRDPAITCFVPQAKMWNEMYERRENGRIDTAYEQIKYQPSVVGYQRNTFFNPATFLSEPSVSFGNSKFSENNWPPVLSTMFSALKMAWWLGAFRLFLVGCDWEWDYHKSPYHFEMKRGVNVYASNNSSYEKMTPMLAALKPVFDAAGFQVYNCNPKSKLTVFPHISFEDAIESTTSRLPTDLTANEWYGKTHEEDHIEDIQTGEE